MCDCGVHWVSRLVLIFREHWEMAMNNIAFVTCVTYENVFCIQYHLFYAMSIYLSRKIKKA